MRSLNIPCAAKFKAFYLCWTFFTNALQMLSLATMNSGTSLTLKWPMVCVTRFRRFCYARRFVGEHPLCVTTDAHIPYTDSVILRTKRNLQTSQSYRTLWLRVHPVSFSLTPESECRCVVKDDKMLPYRWILWWTLYRCRDICYATYMFDFLDRWLEPRTLNCSVPVACSPSFVQATSWYLPMP